MIQGNIFIEQVYIKQIWVLEEKGQTSMKCMYTECLNK